MSETYTITFGDQAENHVGMEKIGFSSKNGFTKKDLEYAKNNLENKGISCELINLGNDAYILVAKNALDKIIKPYTYEQIFNEHKQLNYDSKCKMYGRVVNKHARHNLCFSDYEQQAEFEKGKGTVISFNNLFYTNLLRESWHFIIGNKATKLQAEGNYYYDINKCGIGYHGDSERKIVIGVRLGASMPLYYQWFYNSEPIGEKIKIELNGGDVYFMSEKATGNDWKTRSIHTLRHATGAKKYTN